MTQALIAQNKSYGSPYDRGSADAYYSYPQHPHCYKNIDGKRIYYSEIDMTADEVRDYYIGYNTTTDRKDYRDHYYRD